MTEYYNPLRDSFQLAKRLDQLSFWLMVVSTLLSLSSYFLNMYSLLDKFYIEILSNINVVIILVFAIIKFAISYLLFYTSFDKRADFIDNSFGTNYSTSRSNQYYNNLSVEAGVLRMGANSFESCFFTYSLAVKSIISKWIVNIIITCLIIGVALQGYNSILAQILQLSLPIYLITDAINHSIFCVRIKTILNDFCRLYNDLLDEVGGPAKKQPEIILTVLNYETTLSTFSLLISEKTYNKYNPILSQKWEVLQNQYKLR